MTVLLKISLFWTKIMKVKKMGAGLFWFILGVAIAATCLQIWLGLSQAGTNSQLVFAIILIFCWGLFISLPKIYLTFYQINRDLNTDCFEK